MGCAAWVASSGIRGNKTGNKNTNQINLKLLSGELQNLKLGPTSARIFVRDSLVRTNVVVLQVSHTKFIIDTRVYKYQYLHILVVAFTDGCDLRGWTKMLCYGRSPLKGLIGGCVKYTRSSRNDHY